MRCGDLTFPKSAGGVTICNSRQQLRLQRSGGRSVFGGMQRNKWTFRTMGNGVGFSHARGQRGGCKVFGFSHSTVPLFSWRAIVPLLTVLQLFLLFLLGYSDTYIIFEHSHCDTYTGSAVGRVSERRTATLQAPPAQLQRRVHVIATRTQR